MELSTLGLKDRAQWEAKGYQLPQFDRAAVTEATRENPCWIHFGAGNIFRAFQANVMQNILNRGEMETGLIVAEGFDYEIIEKMNRPHDDYSILVTLKADGSVEKTVVGSVVESCILDSENEGEYGRLKEIFCKQSLQMVSFTITEKGYGKKTPVEEYRITNRGGLGIKNYMVTEKTGGIVGVKVVDGSEDLLLVTRAGILIRTPVEAIRTTGRATQGVIVMRFKEEGDSVISMALTEHEESEE